MTTVRRHVSRCVIGSRDVDGRQAHRGPVHGVPPELHAVGQPRLREGYDDASTGRRRPGRDGRQTVVVASSDDPYASVPYAATLART